MPRSAPPIVGSLFVVAPHRSCSPTGCPPERAAGGSSNSFTPALVKSLPGPVRDVIVGAYNDALTPVFLYMVPLVLIAVVLLFFVKEKPLATTIERDVLPTPSRSTVRRIRCSTSTRPSRHATTPEGSWPDTAADLDGDERERELVTR